MKTILFILFITLSINVKGQKSAQREKESVKFLDKVSLTSDSVYNRYYKKNPVIPKSKKRKLYIEDSLRREVNEIIIKL